MAQTFPDTERARAAADGELEAFSELFGFRGHQMWGLAWVVTLDESASAAALADGFAVALRAVRNQPKRADSFPSDLRRRIYQAAVGHARAARGLVPGRLSTEGEAFAGLPERWRAALWLEASGLGVAETARVLGVSPGTAVRLLARGTATLRRRLSLLSEAVPASLDPTVAALVPPIAVGVPGLAVRRWRLTTLGESTPRALPAAASPNGVRWRLAAGGCAAVVVFGGIAVGLLTNHLQLDNGLPPRSAVPAPSVHATVPTTAHVGTPSPNPTGQANRAPTTTANGSPAHRSSATTAPASPVTQAHPATTTTAAPATTTTTASGSGTTRQVALTSTRSSQATASSPSRGAQREASPTTVAATTTTTTQGRSVAAAQQPSSTSTTTTTTTTTRQPLSLGLGPVASVKLGRCPRVTLLGLNLSGGSCSSGG